MLSLLSTFLLFFLFFLQRNSLYRTRTKNDSLVEKKKKDSLLHLRESYDVSISNGPIHNGSFSFSFHSLFYSLAVSEGFQLTPSRTLETEILDTQPRYVVSQMTVKKKTNKQKKRRHTKDDALVTRLLRI